MYTNKVFKTRELMNKWIESNSHKYQIQEIYLNNAYGLEIKKLRQI
jgi:hypothetical protein